MAKIIIFMVFKYSKAKIQWKQIVERDSETLIRELLKF